MSGVAQQQLSLPGWVRRERQLLAYKIEEVRTLPHEGAAVDLCMRCGGYQQDELADDIGVDAGTFSKVLSGAATLKWPKLVLLMDLCGNEIPLIWRVEQRAYDFTTLRRYRNELEQRIADLEGQVAKKDEHIALLTQVMSGKVPK